MTNRIQISKLFSGIRLRQFGTGLMLIIAIGMLGLPDLVYAQEKPKPKTLLEMLFGAKKPVEAPVKPAKKKKKKPGNASGVDAVAKTVIMPKLATASKILVVGDFFAKGIASGLDAAFQNAPGIVIETRNIGAAGLVRDDLFDWATLLPGYMDEVRPALVIVSLGANDRQQMKLNGTREKFKTDLWSAEYERRVMDLSKLALQQKIPLIWVGLPSFRAPTMTADAITLNSIIQAGVSKSGGEFVDIWEGFVDETGQFIISGSDINGQQVRLRSSDGIGLTEAGKRKVAFYLEKPARRLLGTAAEFGSEMIGRSNLPELVSLPPIEVSKTVRTAPINILDPDLDGGATLLGDISIPQPKNTSPIAIQAIFKGPKGRIDDFSLPAK